MRGRFRAIRRRFDFGDRRFDVTTSQDAREKVKAGVLLEPGRQEAGSLSERPDVGRQTCLSLADKRVEFGAQSLEISYSITFIYLSQDS